LAFAGAGSHGAVIAEVALGADGLFNLPSFGSCEFCRFTGERDGRFCGALPESSALAGECDRSGMEDGRAGVRFAAASLRTPRRNSLPSMRQFLATAENCSRCHFTVSLDPTVIGALRRMQAPDGDVSSRVAEVRFEVPPWSSHETSATAHKTVLGSMLRPSMPCVSAGSERSLVTVGQGRLSCEASVLHDPK